MATIGEQIQGLRKQQQVTQNDLAKAVGVTTQAVSKWECGGTPDAELLPLIADYFQVSIDHLFGRAYEKSQKLSSYVYQQIQKLPKAKRNQECFRIFYALFNACSDIKEIGAVMKSDEMKLYEGDSMRFGYQMATDDTIALMSLTANFPYAVFLPEPEAGYLDQLLSIPEYVELFSFLSKPHCLKLLFQLYQIKNGFTISLMAKRLETTEAELLPLVKEMVKRHWVHEARVDTEQETLMVYALEDCNTAVLPFLMLAKEVRGAMTVGYTVITREKPILYHNEHKT